MRDRWEIVRRSCIISKQINDQGAAEALRAPIGAPRSDGEQALYEQWVAAVRGQLDLVRFDALWTTGQTMSHEAAVDYRLAMTISHTNADQ